MLKRKGKWLFNRDRRSGLILRKDAPRLSSSIQSWSSFLSNSLNSSYCWGDRPATSRRILIRPQAPGEATPTLKYKKKFPWAGMSSLTFSSTASGLVVTARIWRTHTYIIAATSFYFYLISILTCPAPVPIDSLLSAIRMWKITAFYMGISSRRSWYSTSQSRHGRVVFR